MDVGEQAHAVALVETAGDLRNVGGGIAIAEQRFELGPLRLRKHLAMARFVEAVDHHPVVAGQLA